MATFIALGQIAATPEFQSRVAYSMGVAAAAVYSEVNTVTGHAARAAYAVKVANGSYNLASAAMVVLGNSTIAAEANNGISGNAIPDADIQFAVNSLWNMLAGA
jgi:hypothetical protein